MLDIATRSYHLLIVYRFRANLWEFLTKPDVYFFRLCLHLLAVLCEIVRYSFARCRCTGVLLVLQFPETSAVKLSCCLWLSGFLLSDQWTYIDVIISFVSSGALLTAAADRHMPSERACKCVSILIILLQGNTVLVAFAYSAPTFAPNGAELGNARARDDAVKQYMEDHDE